MGAIFALILVIAGLWLATILIAGLLSILMIAFKIAWITLPFWLVAAVLPWVVFALVEFVKKAQIMRPDALDEIVSLRLAQSRVEWTIDDNRLARIVSAEDTHLVVMFCVLLWFVASMMFIGRHPALVEPGLVFPWAKTAMSIASFMCFAVVIAGGALALGWRLVGPNGMLGAWVLRWVNRQFGAAGEQSNKIQELLDINAQIAKSAAAAKATAPVDYRAELERYLAQWGGRILLDVRPFASYLDAAILDARADASSIALLDRQTDFAVAGALSA